MTTDVQKLPPPLRTASFGAMLWQAAIFGALAAALLYLFHNLSHNLESRGATTGFAFLDRAARIPISNSPLAFEPGVSTYAFALFVGALNTLKITISAGLLASVIGLVVGIGRLSSNLLVSRLSAVYVEGFRNVPILVHILIWYSILANMPGPREALSLLPGVFVSNRGINVPSINMSPLGVDWPVLDGFSFSGGAEITPEYGALVIGIGLYTAAFIAEIVRSGIQSVNKGQWEAAGALGLSQRVALFKVVLPQALRIGIPPVTSEFLSVLKNSSLAVAIGYQELVSVGNTTLYETGQAVEVIAITMVFYLAVSLAVSSFMNWYNARVALVER